MNTSEVLQYLAQHLSIDEDFTVRLPNTPDLAISGAIVARLQASSRELQAGFLQDHLQIYLFERYFRSHRETESIGDFANDSAGSIHSEFYRSLEQANPGLGYYDWHWTIEELWPDGWISLVKNGLHLQMPETHGQPPENRKIGDDVAIVMPKNLLTVDRYIAVGDRGRPQGSPIANIYFNCPSVKAIELLSLLAVGLNRAGLPFELALLIDEQEYPRGDGVILRLDRAAYPLAENVLRAIYSDLGADWGASFPLGTKFLAPGAALAESIDLEQDFGRSFLGSIARGLANAWRDKLEYPEQRWVEIQNSLEQAEFDCTAAHLIESDDIYERWR
jgi:hypothetical protein